MTGQLTATGMVLSAMPIGEYDKRLVILTREYGKISAFAKGARRQNSALLAAGQPFSFGRFTLLAGRSSYTVISADISNYFSEIRSELETVCYGSYFCEFADSLTRESMECTDILKLLYQSLRVLVKRPISLPLLRYIFELKILTLNGEGPQVFECASHRPPLSYPREGGEGWGFSARAGGLVCGGCLPHTADAFFLSPASVYTLQFINSTPIEKLYTFTVSDEVLAELERAAGACVRLYTDTDFKALKLLNPYG